MLLEHHPLPLAGSGDDFAGDGDFAAGDVLQAGDHVEKGCLAATAAADQRDEFILRDRQVDFFQNRHRAAVPLRECLAHAINANEGRAAPLGTSDWALLNKDIVFQHDGLPSGRCADDLLPS